MGRPSTDCLPEPSCSGRSARTVTGPLADSRAAWPPDVADITGGTTLVANLRDGLFGPGGQSGDNVKRVFGPFAGSGVSPDDWAGRYVAWMGLGGTPLRSSGPGPDRRR